MCVQSLVSHTMWRHRLSVSLVPWPSPGSLPKAQCRTLLSPRETAATSPRATAVRQRVCLRTFCAARITLSWFTPQTEHVAALEALQWKYIQV